MFFLVLGLIAVLSVKVVEYRFGVNYGQIFIDYSNNDNEGVNGASHLTTANDVILTDRGAYFDEAPKAVTVPKNTFVTKDLTLTNPFTILCWYLAMNKDGIVFYRYKSDDSSNNYIIQKRVDSDAKIMFDIKVNGIFYSGNGGKDSFIKGI